MFFNNNKCCHQQHWQQEGCCNMDACQCGPIIEPTIEKCVERNICHKVEHVCPIHTRIINNHIYEHTYRPEYTTSEENVVTNIAPGCCGQNF